jgi:hypothetical protein
MRWRPNETVDAIEQSAGFSPKNRPLRPVRAGGFSRPEVNEMASRARDPVTGAGSHETGAPCERVRRSPQSFCVQSELRTCA